MNIIISKTIPNNFRNFKVVDSFKTALGLLGVQRIIIHSFIDTDFDAGLFLADLKKKGVKQFIYISSNPSATIRMMLSGVSGYYFEDEFYLEDEEELEVLIEDLNNEDDAENDDYAKIVAPALSTITNFISGFASGDRLVQTPFYLESVESAIKELSDVTRKQEIQLANMGSSAVEVFEKASVIIKGIDSQRRIIETKLNELEANTMNNSGRPAFGNNISLFSSYKYVGNATVCVFREYAPCRYLTSFVLGYLNHLHYELNKKVKLVFVRQRGAGVAAKYANYTEISQASLGMSSLYDAEILVTDCPKKEVFKEIFSKSNEIIIIIDRLYGNNDIVTGRVNKVNFASSRGDIKRYNLNPEDTIFSVTAQPNQLYSIPVIKNFPTESDARLAIYNQAMHQGYELLDKRFHIL